MGGVPEAHRRPRAGSGRLRPVGRSEERRGGKVTGVQTCALPISTAVPLSLHGVPSNSDEWVEFLKLTGGLAPDLPGFGRSGKPGRSEERRVGEECRSRG